MASPASAWSPAATTSPAWSDEGRRPAQNINKGEDMEMMGGVKVSRRGLAVAVAVCGAALMPAAAQAGFQLTDGACNLLAGDPDTCTIIGDAGGTANFI